MRDSLLRKRIELLKSSGVEVFSLSGYLCLSDLPDREKRRHTITALTLLGEERTNEEEELLPQLQGESQDNLEGNASLISSRHPQLPVFSNSVKLESAPGRVTQTYLLYLIYI